MAAVDLRQVRRGSYVAQRLFLALLYGLSRGLSGLRVTYYTDGQHGTDSQHPLGTAIDLGVRTAAERSAALALAARWRAIGLYAVDEGDHVHLQLFDAGRDTLV